MSNLAFSSTEENVVVVQLSPLCHHQCAALEHSTQLILPAGDKVSTAAVAEGAVKRKRDQDKEHLNRKSREIQGDLPLLAYRKATPKIAMKISSS